ncbi:MAG: hypothetical protein L0211_06270 [Planctomycetaceae bacterium]|nr:hypothetical protein [Planctomycetaceae bacterium]
MKLDPVLAEIRATREAFSERFHGDIDAMLADLRKRQAEGGRKSVRLSPKRLTPEELARPIYRVPVATRS